MRQVPPEYEGFDFGFSSVDVLPEVEQNDALKTDIELEREKIKKLEAIIMPLLSNLLSTADKDYILWKNRGPVIQEMIDKVLAITRE